MTTHQAAIKHRHDVCWDVKATLQAGTVRCPLGCPHKKGQCGQHGPAQLLQPGANVDAYIVPRPLKRAKIDLQRVLAMYLLQELHARGICNHRDWDLQRWRLAC